MKTAHSAPIIFPQYHGSHCKKVEDIEPKNVDHKVSWELKAQDSISNPENNTQQDILLGNTNQETLKEELGTELYDRYLKTTDQYLDEIKVTSWNDCDASESM